MYRAVVRLHSIVLKGLWLQCIPPVMDLVNFNMFRTKGGNPMKDVWTSDIEEAINEYYGGEEK